MDILLVLVLLAGMVDLGSEVAEPVGVEPLFVEFSPVGLAVAQASVI